MSEIWGAYFREGIYFFFLGGGLIIGILRYMKLVKFISMEGGQGGSPGAKSQEVFRRQEQRCELREIRENFAKYIG